MITDLEEAVAATITAVLAEDATISAVPYVVRASTTRAEVPGDRTVVAVRVQQGDRSMVALIDAVAEIIVATPANNEDTSIAGHKLVEKAVDRVFSPGTEIGEGEEAVTVSAHLSGEIEDRIAGYTGGGFFNEGWAPGRDDTNFLPVLRVKVGAVRE
jgi:hypothetical protein